MTADRSRVRMVRPTLLTWIAVVATLGVVAGTVAAFFLATQADRIGRRRLLLITVTGYTVMTALTAAAPNLVWYTVTQFLAQVFLGAEWAAAVTMVVEEYPQDRRGRALGVLTSMGTLGGISVGLLGFVGFMGNPLGWRAFYLVGLIPLVVVAIARRGLRETRRYEAAVRGAEAAGLNRSDIFEPWAFTVSGKLPMRLALIRYLTAVTSPGFKSSARVKPSLSVNSNQDSGWRSSLTVCGSLR